MSEQTDPNADKRPRYLQVKRAILELIRTGSLKPGDLIPGEEELAQQHQCARVTAHRALRELADEGVLDRRRKAGTRVAAPMKRTTQFEIPLVDVEIRQSGADYHYSLLERTIAVPSDATRVKLDMKRGEEALHIRCLHYANGTPYQYEDRWINLDIVPHAIDADFDAEGPNAWLVREVPWSGAEHELYAENASHERASLLDIQEHDAVFVVERRTWTGDKAITFVRLYHPGKTHRMRGLRMAL